MSWFRGSAAVLKDEPQRYDYGVGSMNSLRWIESCGVAPSENVLKVLPLPGGEGRGALSLKKDDDVNFLDVQSKDILLVPLGCKATFLSNNVPGV